jgi:oxygen-independent coproporphyrinogen-3 oxidase
MAELAGRNLPETRETLSVYDRFNETLMIGLRTKWGVSKNELFGNITPDEDWFKIVKDYEDQRLLIETPENFVLTESGRLLADAIASELFIIE